MLHKSAALRVRIKHLWGEGEVCAPSNPVYPWRCGPQ